MRRLPAHWTAPEIVIFVRALHLLGTKRKIIRAMTGISDTGITHFVTKSERHRTRVTIAEPGTQDLFHAANQLATFIASKRDGFNGSSHELPRRNNSEREEFA